MTCALEEENYSDMPDLVSDDNDEEYDEEPDNVTLYFKYEFEGCTTIDEVIQRLDELRNYFQSIKDEGHSLVQPIDSGHCIFTKLQDS